MKFLHYFFNARLSTYALGGTFLESQPEPSTQSGKNAGSSTTPRFGRNDNWRWICRRSTEPHGGCSKHSLHSNH